MSALLKGFKMLFNHVFLNMLVSHKDSFLFFLFPEADVTGIRISCLEDLFHSSDIEVVL